MRKHLLWDWLSVQTLLLFLPSTASTFTAKTTPTHPQIQSQLQPHYNIISHYPPTRTHTHISFQHVIYASVPYRVLCWVHLESCSIGWWQRMYASVPYRALCWVHLESCSIGWWQRMYASVPYTALCWVHTESCSIGWWQRMYASVPYTALCWVHTESCSIGWWQRMYASVPYTALCWAQTESCSIGWCQRVNLSGGSRTGSPCWTVHTIMLFHSF